MNGAMSEFSPLSGPKRKLNFGAVRAAFDPGRTNVPLPADANFDRVTRRSLAAGGRRCAIVGEF